MRALFLRCLFTLVLLCALLLTSCNAFDAFEKPGQSNDPEILLYDAEMALRQGRPDQAVRFLRRALEIAPDHALVRIKLATALLTRHDIDVMDFMLLAEQFAREVPIRSSALRVSQHPARALSCNFPESDPHTPFDPTQVSNYDELKDHQSVLEEIQRLVDRVLTGEEQTPGSDLDEPVADVIERLRAEGLTETEIAEALLNSVVAYGTLAYLDIAESGGEEFTFYHVTPPSGERYIGYCAPDSVSLDRVLATIACHLPEADYARRLVHGRADLLGSDNARELADLADEGYTRLTQELDASCSGAEA